MFSRPGRNRADREGELPASATSAAASGCRPASPVPDRPRSNAVLRALVPDRVRDGCIFRAFGDEAFGRIFFWRRQLAASAGDVGANWKSFKMKRMSRRGSRADTSRRRCYGLLVCRSVP